MGASAGGEELSLDEAVARVQSRIEERRLRAWHTSLHDPDPTIRKMMHDYVAIICKRRAEFMQAALRCEWYAEFMFKEDETLRAGAVEDLIVKPPAGWDFTHTYVFGDIPDAICCYHRYDACQEYLGVSPVLPDDPWHPMQVPLRHKETSPWYQRLKRRRELKHQLGPYRSLVGYARKWTKAEFLDEFTKVKIPKEELIQYGNSAGTSIWYGPKKGDPRREKRIPDIQPWELLQRTGYTPAEFWREVKKPNTIKPRKPQLELSI